MNRCIGIIVLYSPTFRLRVIVRRIPDKVLVFKTLRNIKKNRARAQKLNANILGTAYSLWKTIEVAISLSNSSELCCVLMGQRETCKRLRSSRQINLSSFVFNIRYYRVCLLYVNIFRLFIRILYNKRYFFAIRVKMYTKKKKKLKSVIIVSKFWFLYEQDGSRNLISTAGGGAWMSNAARSTLDDIFLFEDSTKKKKPV